MGTSDPLRRLSRTTIPNPPRAIRRSRSRAALAWLAAGVFVGAILLLPAGVAVAVPAGWDVLRIPASADSVDLSGDWVVWSHQATPGAVSSVFAYDLAHPGGPTLLTTSAYEYTGVRPKVSGTRVVWPQKDAVGDDVDIFLYDLAVGGAGTNLTADEVAQRDPDISGDTVVWMDRESMGASWEVTVYDLGTAGPRRVISGDTAVQESPAISGSRVVWTAGAVGRVYDIAYKDTATADPARWLTDNGYLYWHGHPSVSGHQAVYSVYSRAGPPEPGVLVGIVLEGLHGTPAAVALSPDGHEPAIAGSNVVWTAEDGEGGDTDIFLLRLGVSSDPLNLSAEPGEQSSPAVETLADGRVRVAWVSSTGEVVVVTNRLPTTFFADVSGAYAYASAIEALAARGIISGYELPGGGYEFRPSDPIRRAQFAKVIVGSLGLPVHEQMTSPFTDFNVPDVPDNLYPQEFVASAWMNGITTGVSTTRFDPWSYISRAQVVTMMVRAVERIEPGLFATPPAGFGGSWGDFGEPHAAYARIAEYNGLLAGLPLAGAASNPWGTMPRGEVAQVEWNMIDLLEAR